MNEQNCENCRYALPAELSKASDYVIDYVIRCHRQPPVIVPCEDDDLLWGEWPHVGKKMWCGEWKAREEE